MAEINEALPTTPIDDSPQESAAKTVVSFLMERSPNFVRLTALRKKVRELEVFWDQLLIALGLGESQGRQVFQSTEKRSRQRRQEERSLVLHHDERDRNSDAEENGSS